MKRKTKTGIPYGQAVVIAEKHGLDYDRFTAKMRKGATLEECLKDESLKEVFKKSSRWTKTYLAVSDSGEEIVIKDLPMYCAVHDWEYSKVHQAINSKKKYNGFLIHKIEEYIRPESEDKSDSNASEYTKEDFKVGEIVSGTMSRYPNVALNFKAQIESVIDTDAKGGFDVKLKLLEASGMTYSREQLLYYSHDNNYYTWTFNFNNFEGIPMRVYMINEKIEEGKFRILAIASSPDKAREFLNKAYEENLYGLYYVRALDTDSWENLYLSE